MRLLLALAILPAYAVGRFFIRSDPGEPEPPKEIQRSIFFGVLSVVLGVVFALLLSILFTGKITIGAEETARYSPLPFTVIVFAFAASEELVKFLPIAWYLHKKPFFNEHTDGIIYFSLVGLTFGAIEHVLYGLGAGESGAITIILRMVIALFFHGATTSIAGYYFARAKLARRSMLTPAVALTFVIGLHTLYNYFAYNFQSQSLFLFAAAAVGVWANGMMFWLYYVAIGRDMKLGLTRHTAPDVPPKAA